MRQGHWDWSSQRKTRQGRHDHVDRSTCLEKRSYQPGENNLSLEASGIWRGKIFGLVLEHADLVLEIRTYACGPIFGETLMKAAREYRYPVERNYGYSDNCGSNFTWQLCQNCRSKKGIDHPKRVPALSTNPRLYRSSDELAPMIPISHNIKYHYSSETSFAPLCDQSRFVLVVLTFNVKSLYR